VAGSMCVPFSGCTRRRGSAKRAIILGFDGMDPGITTHMIKQHRLPNLQRLAERGMFSVLGTSTPPQSPVAWSNFIAGADPGVHGIFDFIARDAATRVPYLSTSRIVGQTTTVRLGKYEFPLSGGDMTNLRQGPNLWDQVEMRGYPATVLRIPSNFPPITKHDSTTLSGLGTPDIHGGYGIFTCFTNQIGERTRSIPGGHIERIRLRNNRIETALPGPANTFLAAGGVSSIPITINKDPATPAARIRIGANELLLKEGEWSEWLPLQFEMVPHMVSLPGMCRLYLKICREDFVMYVTPINIDPADPAMPVSSPDKFSKELADRIGRYYTQGMAEDTSALSSGFLTDDEYREQSLYVFNESMRMFHSELPRFTEGLFFFYFSCLDQNAHAFWRTLDRDHPLYTPELARTHGDYLPWLYEQLDKAAGEAMLACDDESFLMVLSDHGFGSFRRQFNLNSWLLDNGYATPVNRHDRTEAEYFANTEWGETRAYGLGINSLYLNLAGREPEGCVKSDDFDRLRREIARKLEQVVDPESGGHPIHRVFLPEDIYHGDQVKNAPDLVIGYHQNWRASWDTILGKYPEKIYLDNTDPWSGDHCIDSCFCRGCLFCNQKLAIENPGLEDLSRQILNYFES
jgi:predicted AlkP superfamily phosphohydrolase/phosphomutase